MSVVKPSFKVMIASLVTALIVGCNSPGNNNRNNHNKAEASPTVPVMSSVTNANKGSAVATPARSPAGVIVVTSTPPDAIVVLVREEEGSSGNPERKGATPVTINGVAPGKYSITLEKTGYRYFQKEVEVKENKTVKIAANLKRG